MKPESNLLRLQRHFMQALREPIFGASRSHSELPPRSGAVSSSFLKTADKFISPSATLEPSERLELYHRQYWYRLLDSIAEDFPSLRLLLGDKMFWRLIEAYLESVPPTSFTLRHLGASLASFIAAQPKLVPNPIHAEELAKLEYALCLAFEAREAKPLLPSRLNQVQLALQPHLQLFALRTKADVLWRRSRRLRSTATVQAPAAKANRYLAVFRQELELYVERLPRAAFLILKTINETHSLELAIADLTQRGLLRGRDQERIGQWFGSWISRGWLCQASENIGDKITNRSN